jgi:hypothetical protein
MSQLGGSDYDIQAASLLESAGIEEEYHRLN